MKRYIEHLQGRPGHEKKRISMQAAVGITGAVFVVWISTLGVRLTNDIAKGNEQSSQGAKLVAGAAAAGENLANQFGELRASLSNFGQVSADNTNKQSSVSAQQATVIQTTDEQ